MVTFGFIIGKTLFFTGVIVWISPISTIRQRKLALYMQRDRMKIVLSNSTIYTAFVDIYLPVSQNYHH